MATSTWVGADTAGTWSTPGNWNNGVPTDIAVASKDFNTVGSYINVNQDIGAITALSVGDTNGTTRVYYAGTTNLTIGSTWNIPASNVTVTVNGGISDFIIGMAGTGKLTINSGTAGSILFFSANSVGTAPTTTSWSGGIELNNGSSVQFRQNNRFGTGQITLHGGSTFLSATQSNSLSNNFLIDGNVIINSTSAYSALSISGTVTLGAGGSWTITNEQTVAFNGVVQGSGGLVKAGTSSLTLAGANTFTGTASATAGTLTVSNTNALQDATYLPGAGGTVTFTGNPVIGGLTGSGAFTPSVTVTFGGVNATKNDTFSGTISPATLQPLTMNSGTGLSVQTWSSSSSVRNTVATNITRGAFQITTTAGLYTSGATGLTTTSSGGGLWISGSITPNFGPITITGTGAAGSVNGAIRNVSGNNPLTSTVSLCGSATIQSDAGILTLSTLTLGTANTLTLKTTGAGGITLGAAATGTGTSKVLVPTGSTVKAGVGVSSALAAVTNEIDGTFDVNVVAQTIASGKTLQVDGTWAGGTTTTTIQGTLDGIGSMTGSGTVSISTGGALKAGSGAANSTLSIAGPLTFAAGAQSMTLPGGAGTTLSKVAVTGALTHTGTVTLNATSSTGWTNNSTQTFLTYASRSGAGTFTKGTLSGGTGRQDIGNIVAGATAATFDVVVGNINNNWNGGTTGTGAWFNEQPTGWSGTSGLTDFLNGDFVTFDASNTTTAALTGNVSVASLTMNAAAHTIGGSFTLTNTGALTVSGAFTQTLNSPGDFQSTISVAAGSTLAFGNPNALGTSTGILTLTGASPVLQWNSILGFSTNKSITLSAAATNQQFFVSVGNATATLAGVISGGNSSAFLTKTGSGVVSLTNTNTFTSILRVGGSTSETVGANVLRVVPAALPSVSTRLNAGSILEIDNGATPYTFSRTYGTGATSYYTENLVASAGGGFSSRGTGGITVSGNITFGATPTTLWTGPLYIGTAAQIGSSQGDVTFSGAVDLKSIYNQTIYVFSGSRAVFQNLTTTYTTTAPRAVFGGSGTVRVSSASSLTCEVGVDAGTLEVTSTTFNIFPYIAVGSATVSKPSDIGAVTYGGTIGYFNPGGTLAAYGAGTFTARGIDYYGNIVTLDGDGYGFTTDYSGGASGLIKQGTGTWEIGEPFASTGTGGVEVRQGLLKATYKSIIASGPIVLKGGNLQFTDTTTDTKVLGSIASLSTVGQTSTPRIILGA